MSFHGTLLVTVKKCRHMSLKYSDMGKAMAMAMARSSMYISADEGNVLTKVERWSSDSKKTVVFIQ
jgi:hypothetical protein